MEERLHYLIDKRVSNHTKWYSNDFHFFHRLTFELTVYGVHSLRLIDYIQQSLTINVLHCVTYIRSIPFLLFDSKSQK